MIYRKKIISTILILFFIVNDVSGAADGICSIRANTSTLAPRLAETDTARNSSLQASLICQTIEKMARYGDEVLDLEKIKRWIRSRPSGEVFTKTVFLDYDGEIHIVVNNELLIRYYRPAGSPLAYLFGGDRTPVGFQSEEKVNAALNRQIYTIQKVPPHQLVGVFSHIARKARVNDRIRIAVQSFPLAENEYPLAELWPDGACYLHPEFEHDMRDIGRVGVGFPYMFDDRVMRWVNVSDSIAYRVAMHEFKLDGRDGHGHGYRDEAGQLALKRDEEQANMVGRRYKVIDDAAFLWYLHSYKMNDSLRYNRDGFIRRLNWVFDEHYYDTVPLDNDAIRAESDSRLKAARMFPNLREEIVGGIDINAERRALAIRLAVLINDAYFIERQKLGEDTIPAYEQIVSQREMMKEGDRRTTLSEEMRPVRMSDSTSHTDTTAVQAGANPEDEVELPYIGFKEWPKRNLSELIVELNAAVDIERALRQVAGNFNSLRTYYRVSQGYDENIVRSYNELMEALNAISADINCDIVPDRDYAYYSAILKTLRDKHKQLYRDMAKADKEGNRDTLKRLNVEAIRLNMLMIKLRIKVATLVLNGQSNITTGGGMLFIAETMVTKGARTSAQFLVKELKHRIKRLQTMDIVRETETLDPLGRLIKVVRLKGFDIEFRDKKEKEGQITVRQRRWINVHASLDRVRESLRRGSPERALQIIDMITPLYNERYIKVSEDYLAVKANLRQLRDMIAHLPASQAPPSEQYKTIREKTLEIAAQVIYPKRWVWSELVFGSLDKGLRGMLHQIAGYEIEIFRLQSAIADLEDFADSMAAAAEKGKLAQDKRRLIMRKLEEYIAWTHRGSVLEKQNAEIELKNAEGLLRNEEIDAVDLNKAARHLRETMAELAKRIDWYDEPEMGIKQKIATRRKRADALFVQYRDRDIKARVETIRAKVKSRDFEQAKDEVQDLQELYFDYDVVEPGYIRAVKRLRLASGMINGAIGQKSPVGTMAKIDEQLQAILNKDLAHKMSFIGYASFRPGLAGLSWEVYFSPGARITGFLNMLKARYPKEAGNKLRAVRLNRLKVNIGHRTIEPKDFDKFYLKDETKVEILLPTRAAGDSGDTAFRDVGPGTPTVASAMPKIKAATNKFVSENESMLADMLGEDKEEIVERIPVEILAAMGEDNAKIFLSALGQAKNVIIELFSATGEVSVTNATYLTYGIEQKKVPQELKRTYTVTLFLAKKGESLRSRDLEGRLGGPHVSAVNSILVPVGYYTPGQDLSGLIRSTMLGLRLMKIARDKENDSLDEAYVRETRRQFADLCKLTSETDSSMTEQEFIDWAGGNPAEVASVLSKVIGLLPIVRIDVETLRSIIDHAKEVISAA
ncbi:MAG: hypothetical protein PHS37_07030 [Candidatus Omnitrophica bacterium]|nr:hypothetical protein [Candidatus Omnitrophota bacterium]